MGTVVDARKVAELIKDVPKTELHIVLTALVRELVKKKVFSNLPVWSVVKSLEEKV